VYGPVSETVKSCLEKVLKKSLNWWHTKEEGTLPRLMSLTLELEGSHMANLVNAYAPTLLTPDDAKDEFYNQLDQIISCTPCKHKPIMMGDFNTRVRCDHQAWEKVIGRQSKV